MNQPHESLSRRIKAVVFDLDGTILKNDKTFSPRTVKMIRALERSGIIPIIATGRCRNSARSYQRTLDLSTPLICCNGACVTEEPSGKELLHVHLEDAVCRELVALSREFDVHLHAYMNERLYFEQGSKEADTHDLEAQHVGITVDFDQIPNLECTKVMCIGNEDRLDKIHRQLRDTYHDKLLMVYTYFNYFEVMDKRAGKRQALEFVLNRLGITREETMAFGDAENDKDMITWVSYGVAMGNAPEDVRSAAPFRADTNEQDGAARFVEEFFSLKL